MPLRTKTAVSVDYEIYAQQQRSEAISLEAEGNVEAAQHYYAAARHYQEKAESAIRYLEQLPVAMGEVTTPSGKIAWKAKNTLHTPEQVHLDASTQRKELLLGPCIDVCALAMDAA